MSDAANPRDTARSMAASPDITERITRLMTDYNAAIDNDRLELWPDFFVQNCFYSVIGRSDHEAGRLAGFIYCDNRDMLVDRIRSLRSANVYQPHLYRHIISPPRVLAVSGDLVRSETSYALIRTSLPDGAMVVSAGPEAAKDAELTELRHIDPYATGRYVGRYIADGNARDFQIED